MSQWYENVTNCRTIICACLCVVSVSVEDNSELLHHLLCMCKCSHCVSVSSLCRKQTYQHFQCELRFPKQRILAVAEEEDYEDSDEEDVSMVAMTTRATKLIMYYLTDSERFQPPQRKPR